MQNLEKENEKSIKLFPFSLFQENLKQGNLFSKSSAN
jgi:hypothetical protein